MTTLLRDLIHDELDQVPVPPGDLAAVRRRGGRIRTARRAGVGGVALAAVVGVVAAAGIAGLGDDTAADRGVQPLGSLDYSQGLRAFADPGHEVHLGGRTFPAKDLQGLDTDAAATPDGIVYYDHGVPLLLDASGASRPLEPGAEEGSFSPTAKADAAQPWVAYGAQLDGSPTVVVRDTETGDEIARREVGEGTVIDALDHGVVILRDATGTVAWTVADDSVEPLSGPRTRVADLRSSVLLYDGPKPDGAAARDFRIVPGAIDAQLSFDGEHVLSWSDRLESTTGGDTIRLGLPNGAAWFTFDTDGSVLAASGSQGGAEVYDCLLTGEPCEPLGSMTTRGGDPAFIGDDM